MENSLISIIVPVYNAQAYLADTIQSILNQTYQNLELILVDDGSVDDSLAICQRYAREDERVRVVTKENGGPSAARNMGIQLAQGEWFGFVDADDVAEMDMYEKMMRCAIVNRAKIVSCGIKIRYGRGNERKILFDESTGKISTEKALESVIKGTAYSQAVWNKLFNKEIVTTIKFSETTFFGEDTIYVIEATKLAEGEIAVVNECLYQYIRREGSHAKSFSNRHLENLEQIEKNARAVGEISSRLEGLAKGYIVINVATMAYMAIDNDRGDLLPILQKKGRAYLSDLLGVKDKGIPLRLKLLATLMILFPRLGYRVRKYQRRLDG